MRMMLFIMGLIVSLMYGSLLYNTFQLTYQLSIIPMFISGLLGLGVGMTLLFSSLRKVNVQK